MLTPDPTYRIQPYSETPLEDLLNEMSQSRESFTAPEPKLDSIPDSPALPDAQPVPYTDVSGVVVVDEAAIKGKRQNTAKWLGKNTDRALAFATSLIADTDDIDEWKADPDDLKDIIECYYEMCEGYGWTGLPPWLNLVLCIGFTYGPQMREAMKVRGINKELSRKAAQAEADRAIAQAELIRIKLEQERAKIPAPSAEKTEPETKTEPTS